MAYQYKSLYQISRIVLSIPRQKGRNHLQTEKNRTNISMLFFLITYQEFVTPKHSIFSIPMKANKSSKIKKAHKINLINMNMFSL